MSDKTIPDYSNAGGIDASADLFLLWQNSTNTYRKITRNVVLGTTGTPVDTTSVQTLQNKVLDNSNTITVKDNLFTLQDDGDTSKQAKFQLSGITAATTRTYTLPNASSTLADIATAQTFTNKTLTSPVITGGSIDNSTVTVDAITGHTTANTGTIYGIPITTSKMSGTSITNASITTTQIATSTVAASNINFGGAGAGVWWEEIARTTLSGGADTITVSGIPARTYLVVIIRITATGGTAIPDITFNNDTAANYAYRFSANGAADSTTASTGRIAGSSYPSGTPGQRVMQVTNLTSVEKFAYVTDAYSSTAGAANVPSRLEMAGKWANTSAQINRVDATNNGTGDFATGSEIIVLGHN